MSRLDYSVAWSPWRTSGPDTQKSGRLDQVFPIWAREKMVVRPDFEPTRTRSGPGDPDQIYFWPRSRFSGPDRKSTRTRENPTRTRENPIWTREILLVDRARRVLVAFNPLATPNSSKIQERDHRYPLAELFFLVVSSVPLLYF